MKAARPATWATFTLDKLIMRSFDPTLTGINQLRIFYPAYPFITGQ